MPTKRFECDHPTEDFVEEEISEKGSTVSDDSEYLIFGFAPDRLSYIVKKVNRKTMTEPREIEIPATYKGKPVTGIGPRAFYQCKLLESVKIPDGVREIGQAAFCYCSNLRSVTLPAGLTEIEGESFYGCTALLSVTIPNSVESIGYMVFYGCTSLSSVSLGTGLKKIFSWTFHDCKSLVSVRIPAGVTSILDGPFVGCSALTAIEVEEGNENYYVRGNCLIESATKRLVAIANGAVVPSDGSVTNMGRQVLNNREKLTAVRIAAAESNDGRRTEKGGDPTVIILPPTLDGGDFMIQKCPNLVSVEIPSGVKVLHEYAFEHCKALTTVSIPLSLCSITSNAFSNCRALKYLIYAGTMAQWKRIVKVQEWYMKVGHFIVRCSDGDIDGALT